MTANDGSLGRCPRCDESIAPTWTLIEYEQADGEVGIFAECPECEEVVKPE